MKYSDYYIASHDLDWFCIVNGFYIHVASAGGVIPSQINDKDKIRNIQHQVELLHDIYNDKEIEYNEVAINNVVGNKGAKGRSQYIESFASMARKGFASFDRTNVADPDDNRYHLVCKPIIMDKTPQVVDLYTVNTGDEFEITRELKSMDFIGTLNKIVDL